MSNFPGPIKGPLRKTVGRIWTCGGYYCNCGQAEIVEIYEDLRSQPAGVWVIPERVWEGKFYTDGAWYTAAYSDLLAEKQRLEATEPERAATIVWQFDGHTPEELADEIPTSEGEKDAAHD